MEVQSCNICSAISWSPPLKNIFSQSSPDDKACVTSAWWLSVCLSSHATPLQNKIQWKVFSVRVRQTQFMCEEKCSFQLPLNHICGNMRAFLDNLNRKPLYIIEQTLIIFARCRISTYRYLNRHAVILLHAKWRWAAESLSLGMACLFLYSLVILTLGTSFVKGDVKQNTTYGRLEMIFTS